MNTAHDVFSWWKATRLGLATRLGGATRGGSDDGAAVLEFVVVLLAGVIPLVYLIVAMSWVQRAMLGVSAAARDGARVAASAPTPLAARTAALATIGQILANYQLPQASVQVVLRCVSAVGASCAGPSPTSRGGWIQVSVTDDVALAHIPVIGALVGAVLPVRSVQQMPIALYRSFGPPLRPSLSASPAPSTLSGGSG